MHLGFALFKYFPFGGLQRDMLAIARRCSDRGHRVTVFTSAWEGDRPEFLTVSIVPTRGWTNHARDAAFGRAVRQAAGNAGVDRLVGFNKMPGLDFYYAADSCFAAKVYEERSWLYRCSSRARLFLRMEAAVFAPGSRTQVLLISPAEREIYRRYYQTPADRLQTLPPGIRRDRVMPPDYVERRQQFRREQGWDEAEKIILFVGSGFRTKGLDRAIRALAALPDEQLQHARLLVLGKDKVAPFERLALKLGVDRRVVFVGGVDNVSDYLWAADVLLHPAYRENTGTVLLEAMVAGLPVVTTAACGYAPYVSDWQMGQVVAVPVSQLAINRALLETLQSAPQPWRERGARFAREADIYSLPERAAEILTRSLEAASG